MSEAGVMERPNDLMGLTPRNTIAPSRSSAGSRT